MRIYLLKGDLQIEVPVKLLGFCYKFPNLIQMMHIFPIKKGRGSFEKSQQYHFLGDVKRVRQPNSKKKEERTDAKTKYCPTELQMKNKHVV